MFKYDAVSPPVSGWLEISLEKEIIDYLWKIERESRFPGTSVKNTLAGNITESRSLKDTDDYFLKNVLLDCVRNYKEEFPYTIRKPDTISDGNLTLNGFGLIIRNNMSLIPCMIMVVHTRLLYG